MKSNLSLAEESVNLIISSIVSYFSSLSPLHWFQEESCDLIFQLIVSVSILLSV